MDGAEGEGDSDGEKNLEQNISVKKLMRKRIGGNLGAEKIWRWKKLRAIDVCMMLLCITLLFLQAIDACMT